MEFSKENFDRFMKNQGLENITEKLKEVYIVRHRLPGEENATALEEFDTKKEADQWIDDSGRAVIDEFGGKLETDFGPSELSKSDEDKSD